MKKTIAILVILILFFQVFPTNAKKLEEKTNLDIPTIKINIEPDEWLVPIADKYPALERRYKMFEPEKNTQYSSISSKIKTIRTDWLGRVSKVRTYIFR